MAGNILESITAQYHSLTRPGKSWQIIFLHIQEKHSISPFPRWRKTAVSPKLPLPVSVMGWGLRDTMISNWRWQKQTMSQIWASFLILPRELLPKTV